MIRTLNWLKEEQERKDRRMASQRERRARKMEQREAKQIVRSVNMKNVSAECQWKISIDPLKKIAQGGLPSLGKD